MSAAPADGHREPAVPGWVRQLVDGAPAAAERLAALTGAGRGAPGRREGRRAAVLVCLSPGPALSSPALSSPAPAPSVPGDPAPGTAAVGPLGDVLLLERAPGLRAHAGQPALPGGAVDPADDGAVGAALREAHEETGLDPGGVRVLATMPVLRVPPEGFAVTPVIAWEPVPSPVAPGAPEEVVRVLRVPVQQLLDPARRVVVTWERRLPGPGAGSGALQRGEGPGFEVGGLLVWGFTAALLAALLDAGGLGRPWDGARRVGAPAPPAVPRVPAPPGPVQAQVRS